MLLDQAGLRVHEPSREHEHRLAHVRAQDQGELAREDEREAYAQPCLAAQPQGRAHLQRAALEQVVGELEVLRQRRLALVGGHEDESLPQPLEDGPLARDVQLPSVTAVEAAVEAAGVAPRRSNHTLRLQ
eukprot:scaffold33678_cov60-Phaeocystis_antarctica.AAC.1